MELRQALTQIADIRRQMVVARQFRGFRAASTLATAMAAVGAGVWQSFGHVPDAASDPLPFVALWVSVAMASVFVCGGEIAWLYRGFESPSQRELALLAVEQFLPCILVGGLVTFVLSRYAPAEIWMLPGLWQILFGLGIFALRRLAPGPIIYVGAFYVLWGLMNLSGGVPRFSVWSMAVPFGLGQAACAGIFYWYLERRHAA
ncbi:MAG TPA: hypothetical protein VGG19_06540 [Tepidisphaeraceae bacterium]|jgi:hypothetical protein